MLRWMRIERDCSLIPADGSSGLMEPRPVGQPDAPVGPLHLCRVGGRVLSLLVYSGVLLEGPSFIWLVIT